MQPNKDSDKNYLATLLGYWKHRPLTVLTLGFILSSTAIFSYLNHMNNQVIIASAIESSKRHAAVISEFRSLYTSEVITPAMKAGIEVSHDYFLKDNAIPLPATLSLLLSEKMREHGLAISTNLYSLYPFPWRKKNGGLRDDFEKAAWQALSINPKEPYYRIKEIDGVLTIRYAIADTLKPLCVSCHNTHPQSPKTNWNVGDLRGVLEVSAPLTGAAQGANTFFIRMLFMFSALLIFAFAAFSFIFKNLQNNNLTLDTLNYKLKRSIKRHKEVEVQLQTANQLAHLEKDQAQIAQQEAISANKAKSTFLENISHEIRTPMNAILGYTQILKEDKSLQEDNQHYLSIINASGNHLLNLINDILDSSMLESGAVKLQVKNFDLLEICRSTIAMFSLKATQKNILLTFCTDITADSLFVNGDQLRLRQVVINLVGNAIKFTSRGKVTLCLKALEDSVFNFQIIDTGIGIKAQFQEVIFDAFNQGGVSTKYGGTGLGLNIAKKCLKLMSSDIKLISAAGEGSVFSFEICLPIPLKSKGVLGSTNSPALNPSKKTDQSTKTLLIIEQLAASQTSISDALSTADLILFHADNADNALAIISREAIDMVVTNLHPPTNETLTIIQTINHDFPNLPVIQANILLRETSAKNIESASLEHISAQSLNPTFVVQKINTLLKAAAANELYCSISQSNSSEEQPISFELPPEYCKLIIEQCDLYLVLEVEQMIDRLTTKFPDNDAYFSQLHYFVNKYDLEGLTSFLSGDSNAG
ncbi:MAG: DUF3365 domain-containing protein [Oceanospirillaceae bacterium]|nr:DUF3365 domain-containing protein [Oceanospirillaceae bacterium]